MKKCSCCNLEKNYSEFWVAKQNKDGYCGKCKQCINEYKQRPEYKAKEKERRKRKRWEDPEWRSKNLRLQKERIINKPEEYLLIKAKSRARQLGIELNIEVSDIIIPKVCPILKTELQSGTKKNYQQSPSIDRIDSSKGYIKGNVRVISSLANTMKSCATIEQLEQFSKNIMSYISQNDDIV